jgi:hypothetical protein
VLTSLLLPALLTAIPALEPSGKQVAVNGTGELVAALGKAVKGQTLMLADGTYDLSAVEPLRLLVDSLGLYGASRDPAKVILKGQGFAAPNTNEEMIKIEAAHATLAYLTLRDVRANGLKIQTGGNDGLMVHGVNFIDICERSIKGPDAPVSKGGVVEWCLFEQKTPITDNIPGLKFGGDYIAGMDMMKIQGWRIRDNIFKNIRGRNGGGRAAIFLWNGCDNVVVERNLIMGCDRAISLGNPSGTGVEVSDAIIRNNFIVAGAGVSIEAEHTELALISQNTIYSINPGYSRTLFFLDNGAGNDLKNNLVMGKLLVEAGNAPELLGNLFLPSTGAADGWFRDPAAGDLHLTSKAVGAIDKGLLLPEATEDFDNDPRGAQADIGADELGGGNGVRRGALSKPRNFPATAWSGWSWECLWKSARYGADGGRRGDRAGEGRALKTPLE